ncbi:MAG TPA: HAD family phosphatase [Candidatus Acidoferrales bacterium]|nr:HAD family phosphatase [Candidatus Acidoferrales bacterium]
MIRAVIFDMDGLMLDTEPLYRSAWQRAAKEFGYELSDALYARLAGRNTGDAERMLVEEFGRDFPLRQFRIACKRFDADEFSKGPIPKKTGLDKLLALLDHRHIPRAVATSTERSRALRSLSNAELLNGFTAVAAGDEVKNGKPAPDLFELAARRLGVASSNCLVLEDLEPGVRAARSAGMLVYLVPDLHAPTVKVQELASGVFDSLTAVARHLERQLDGG